MPTQGVLEIALTERDADLAEILGVGAQHVRLRTGERGHEHESVEPVGLDLAPVERAERGLELVTHSHRGELDAGWAGQADVVQPYDRRAGGSDLVGTLVDDLHTEVFEQRQHRRQRHGLAKCEELQARGTRFAGVGVVERGQHGLLGAEGLHAVDVELRRRR